VKNVLIGGIGNVLLGDDAIGPYVIRLLESCYNFGPNVEIVDLGTPALDLTHRIAGRDAVILVDCLACGDDPPGTIQLFRKEDILGVMPAQRLDPHSPALAECLMTAEMMGASPPYVLLVGVVGSCYDAGVPLTDAVCQAAARAVDVVLEALVRIGVEYTKHLSPIEPKIWWSDCPSPLHN
jgi:hydrogenase maturation protease